jgi:hypothetical protein
LARKVIVRIKGGLGNQLFCYANARRLALANNAELVIDDVTGFVRDRQYYHQYVLDHFHISVRKATPAERLEPFERYRRGIMKWLSRRKPFAERQYVEQEGLDFDERLLTLKVRETLYLDGLWQSEGYFKGVESVIRDDLRINPPKDVLNERAAAEIRNGNAVAMHVRWFEVPGSAEIHNVSADYYHRAIALMEKKINSPRYYVFSDNMEAARAKLGLPEGRAVYVSHNQGRENAYADLWLMTQCRHFIIANSTLSWWAAWLAPRNDKVVISPQHKIGEGHITAWNFRGQLPSMWVKI